MSIPFNSPIFMENTFSTLKEAFENRHLSGMGPFTKKCEEWLGQHTGGSHLLVSSATHALEMMGLLLSIGPGDEVILPSFTFVSTANAFALRGAKLKFADVDEFGNISLVEVERLLGPKTKLVMAVHYAGNSTDMFRLADICKTAGVALLEDAAQAIGSTCKGQPLGTFGSLGCFSFHETKNVGCGEGGSLIVNQLEFRDRAEILREKGTNRRRFMQGLADKYTWVDIGSSYVLSDLNAAYLYPQLLKLKQINERRNEIYEKYLAELETPLQHIGAKILKTPSHNDNPNAHMFAILFDKMQDRSDFIQYMRSKEISCPFHYVALHSSPFGKAYTGNHDLMLPMTTKFSETLVRLPLFFGMTEKQQEVVVAETKKWLSRR